MTALSRALVVATLSSAGAPLALAQFGPPEIMTREASINHVDLVDVDGDGVIDVLATKDMESAGGEVVFLAGDGDGGLASSVLIGSFAARPWRVRGADVNQDGAVDVAVATDAGIQLYFGQPGGGFGPAVAITSEPHLSLNIADVDQDGSPDLLAGNFMSFGQAPQVLLNDGAGSFTIIDLVGTDGSSTSSILASDVDGDGDADLVRTSFNGTFLHMNDGLLGFTESVLSLEGPSFASIGDIDRDGDDDIARVGLIGAPLEILENTGGGTFAPSQVLFDSAFAVTAPAIADVDGDGWNDIVVAQDALGIIEWVRNDQNGGFVTGCALDLRATGANLAPPVDVDGDFDLDVVTYVYFSGTDRIDLYRNVGAQGINTCLAAVNSTGESGWLTLTGSRSVGQNQFMATATDLPPGTAGLLLAGRMQGQSMPAGSSGTLCIGGNIQRLGGDLAVIFADQAGTSRRAIDLTSFPGPAGAVMAGEAWVFQQWFRDANPSVTSNFTNAVEVTFEF